PLTRIGTDVGQDVTGRSVDGDQRQRGGFDRARSARRQPGSAIKPLVLLEAFDDCGSRSPAYPARHILDEPLEIDLPSGPWRPENSDRRHRGIVTVRDALRDSLNVPFVRLSRWCGETSMARTLRRTGLDLPRPVPPSFVLGAVETSPVDLAGAYTAIAGLGRRVRPRITRRIEKPGGWPIERFGERQRQVVEPASAFLVHDLLRDVARKGTAEGANIEHLPIAAKTGTSSDRRDAWLAGYVGNLVVVVWVGRDDDRPLGLTGSAGAAPLWRAFVERATPAWPWQSIERPRGIVTRHIDPTTGLRVVRLHPRAEPELFRSGALPPRDRWFRDDEPVDVID
ncbi:MAG: penicillin-binding transpeptidase domain-containing protein, partial [Acidobacteriota bacterium]